MAGDGEGDRSFKPFFLRENDCGLADPGPLFRQLGARALGLQLLALDLSISSKNKGGYIYTHIYKR